MANPQINLERDEVILGDLYNFAHLKAIKNPSQAQVRLHAAAVRRLLLDGHLGQSCASRHIKLVVPVPDSLPLVRDVRNGHVPAFLLGGLEIFGIFIAGLMAHPGRPRGLQTGFDPTHRVEMKCDGFLKQVVGAADGNLITRHEVILYVANKAGGVHFDPTPSNSLPASKLHTLGIFRNGFRLGIVEGMPHVRFNLTTLEQQAPLFRYEAAFIDAVYLEFLACVQFLIDSPAVRNLRQAIETDLGCA